MARVFVSIPVPNMAGLNPLTRELSRIEGIRTVAARLHITLSFIGEIDEGRTGDIAECASRTVRGLGPARIALRGIGTFPSGKRPRVVWTGVDTSLPLARMAEGINRGLDAKGIPHDSKRFKAHVTVGRAAGNPDLSLLMRRYRNTEFAAFTARGATVVRSDLAPSGPVYTVLRICADTDARSQGWDEAGPPTANTGDAAVAAIRVQAATANTEILGTSPGGHHG